MERNFLCGGLSQKTAAARSELQALSICKAHKIEAEPSAGSTAHKGTIENPAHAQVEQSEEPPQKELRRFLDSSLLGNTWQAWEAFQVHSKRGINMLCDSHKKIDFPLPLIND
jgi:hypothetical protein